MNSKAISTLLGLGLIALSALAIWQHSEITKLEQQLASLKPPAVLGREAKSPPANPAVAQPTPVVPVPAPANPLAATEPNEHSHPKRIMRDLSAMMENPQMNEMMQASQKATLEVMYKDLLNSFDFSPEEREHLMDLLMTRQMFRVETSMKMMGGASSREERKLLSSEMKEFDQQVNQEIKTFLNNEADVGEFEFYEKTIGERMSLSGFKSSLAKAGKPVTPATERHLLEMMAEQKEAFPFTSDLHNQENYDMSLHRFRADNLDSFESDLGNLHERIAEEAQSLLDSDQLVLLVESLENMRNLQLSQLRMAANMFNARGTGE